MNCTSTRVPYRQTNAFSKIALDYVDQAAALKPFFSNTPSLSGMQKSMESRKKIPTDRDLLVKELRKQYEGINATDQTRKNIDSLLSENTFTITTAHQNNIFTGPLFFIYKIVHVIRLADEMNQLNQGSHIVPVFYMGSEDADLDELNHIHLGGEKLVWDTAQTGAVGRMKVDKALIKLITAMEGQLSGLPNGKELVLLLREYYQEAVLIQDATFKLVNQLFGEYGLVVLLPDNPRLKKQALNIFQDDLLNQSASRLVEESANKLEASGYKVQANPREINLFYLEEQSRNRIEKVNTETSDTEWLVINSEKRFTKEELRKELEEHPERFSPNVILRGMYQEIILPNIAFIGGGGEIAYWLQLRSLFDHYQVPFPVLILRNSFLLVESKWREAISRLGFQVDDFFLPEQELINRWVLRESKVETRLNGSLTEIEKLYDSFTRQASAVDHSLEKHVQALRMKTVQRLQELEKKMLRAEKRKFTDQQRQIHKIKTSLFPADGLQERYENFSYYYALWGNEFIKTIVKNSPALEQEFTILNY